MSLDRRGFLKLSGLAALARGIPALGRLDAEAGQTASGPAYVPTDGPDDYTIRIGRGLVELAPDHIISTVTYNGQFPGPLLRMTEGTRVVVEIQNDTDTCR